MGNATRADRHFSHSVLRVWNDPRVRGSATQAAAVMDMGILADTPLDYGPIIPDALADGTIPADKLTGELGVTAAKFSGADDDEDFIFLYVDGQPVEPLDGTALVGQQDPVPLTIPLAILTALAEGPHTVSFSMGSGFGDSYVSLPTPFLIDRTPPGGDELPLIRFALNYEQNGVTIYQIEADGDVLAASIATYEAQAAGDSIETFIAPQVGGTLTPGPRIAVASPTERHPIDFTLAQLQAAGANDRVDFWYTVKDKAGNLKTSGKSELRMLVTEAPSQLEPPRVPLYTDDDLVNEQDGRTPITVEIPQFGYARAGDVIVLVLGGGVTAPIDPPLAAADLPDDDDNPDPSITIRTVDVPYPILRSLDAQDIFTFACSYRVRRASFMPVQSLALDVDVDLTLAGGPDPDPETPEHEDYQPPVIVHSGAGATDNLIPIGYTPPVFATISHETTDAVPEELFEDGDVVQLYRYDTDGTTRVAVGAQTDATPGSDVIVNLDETADVIAGIWDYFYEVGRTLATGQVNWGVSPLQVVTIEDGSDQPGGPDLLPDAVFRNADTKQGVAAIGYARSQEHGGTIVRIYDYLNMAAGDEIAIHWQGHDSIRGTGSDIVDAVFDGTRTVVANDLVPKDDRLDDDPSRPPTAQPRVFVDFLVTYADMQKVESPEGVQAFGSAWVTYTVTSASGKKNTSKDDREVLRRLAIDARAPA
jgi:hypothetical protein